MSAWTLLMKTVSRKEMFRKYPKKTNIITKSHNGRRKSNRIIGITKEVIKVYLGGTKNDREEKSHGKRSGWSGIPPRKIVADHMLCM